jgi:hypothetical protein
MSKRHCHAECLLWVISGHELDFGPETVCCEKLRLRLPPSVPHMHGFGETLDNIPIFW